MATVFHLRPMGLHQRARGQLSGRGCDSTYADVGVHLDRQRIQVPDEFLYVDRPIFELR